MSAEMAAATSQPRFGRRDREIQPFGTLNRYPIALGENARAASVTDTMAPRDMDKKHHWQIAGPTCYRLHLLSINRPASRPLSSMLSPNASCRWAAVSIAMAHDVAEMTRVHRLPNGRETGATHAPARRAPDYPRVHT